MERQLHSKMHLLTLDVGIFIVLTVKIVVQSDVATDAYSSELFATPCTSASHKAEARKMKRQLHSKNASADAGRRGKIGFDRNDRRST